MGAVALILVVTFVVLLMLDVPIANLCIGLCTPPVGTCLFIGCGVGKTTIGKATPKMLPFFGAMMVALLVISYVPAVSLWLPVQTKQLKPDEVENAFFLNAPQLPATIFLPTEHKKQTIQ